MIEGVDRSAISVLSSGSKLVAANALDKVVDEEDANEDAGRFEEEEEEKDEEDVDREEGDEACCAGKFKSGAGHKIE